MLKIVCILTFLTCHFFTVTLKCRAIGVPDPIIVWRLNGGHIPKAPHVTTSSIKGQGTLIIQEALLSDQGTYSCEAINKLQSVKAQQSSLLVVKRKFLSIPASFFILFTFSIVVFFCSQFRAYSFYCCTLDTLLFNVGNFLSLSPEMTGRKLLTNF